nr:retrovirus-related Pol polyprotein from transposon TNT 1-94 [Tanacetum cinerariifolium]
MYLMVCTRPDIAYVVRIMSDEFGESRMSKVPYANVVGCLMYLMVCTRPDIAYVVRIMSDEFGESRNQRKHVDVDGFVDADYAKEPDKEAEYMALTKLLRKTFGLKDKAYQREISLHQGDVESKEIKVEKIGTEDNTADAFTKVVLDLKFKYCIEILDVGIN